jgi:GDPmannose 4,6-dehydratase
MKKRALITGISGQDGSYLAELLLSKDYDVYGTIRRHSGENSLHRINHILNDLKLDYADLTDVSSIQKMLIHSKPHEIYNLGAQSHVKVSYENPIYTANVVAIGTLNLLDSIRYFSPHSRMYQAGTSEMFGNSVDEDGYQRETTPFKPANPYACSKVFAHQICVNYRNGYNLYISNGILYNHESPRRGENFVTIKIIKSAVDIYKGLSKELKLGTLSSHRDWGHCKDYVRAMWMILQQDLPDDFVCATGISHSVKDLCEYVFKKLNLDYRDYVKIDPNFSRPEETKFLRGDSSKLRKVVGWEPEYTFETLMDEIIDFYLNKN